MCRLLKFGIKICYIIVLSSIVYELVKDVSKSHERVLKIDKEFHKFCTEKFNFDYHLYQKYINLDINNLKHYQIILYIHIFILIMAFLNSNIFIVLSFINHLKFVFILNGLYKLSPIEILFNKEFINLLCIFGVMLCLISYNCSNNINKDKISNENIEKKLK